MRHLIIIYTYSNNFNFQFLNFIAAEKLVHTIFHFYEELIKINGNIIDQLQSTVASFSPVSSSTDTYTIPIKSQVENVLSDANNYAMQFEHIGNVLNAMANKIMG